VTENQLEGTGWSALPTLFALVCIAIGLWIQFRTASFVAYFGAPLYAIASATTLFAAFVVGYRPARRTVASYFASVALVAAILFQWDTGPENHSSYLRVVALLGSDRYRAPSFFLMGPPLLMNALVAVPWAIAIVAAIVPRDEDDASS
jgi:hypothetical protein